MGCISCAGRALEGGGVTLTRRESSPVPVEAGSICPDRFAGLYQTEIEALPVTCGGEQVRLGDLFEVDGAGADDVTVTGDLKTVEKIGLGMTMGRLTVAGDVGPHLGAYMSGGEIVVRGSAGDWAGAHLSGGRIVVEGDAGDAVGAAYPDEPRGMSGGTVVVRGNAGREVGARMRRGLVVVLGDAGESAAAGMLAGSVLVGGRLGRHPGAGMKRGTVVAFGEPPELAPGFEYACRYRPVFLQCYLQTLEAEGLITSPVLPDGEFLSYVGDRDAGGVGEVLVRAQSE
jgi:formylmethanofuran dehydrogenase subunit C